MTQITLTISDPKDASLIKKLLAKFDSVTISNPSVSARPALTRLLRMLLPDELHDMIPWTKCLKNWVSNYEIHNQEYQKI